MTRSVMTEPPWGRERAELSSGLRLRAHYRLLIPSSGLLGPK